MNIVMTGGHHSSAIPVIKKLKETDPKIKIHWLGHRYSLKNNKSDTLEYLEITAMKIPFYDLKAGKAYKTFDVMRLLKIPFGFFQAFYYLVKIKPQLIVSFGGYLAVPTVIAGWLLGIPCITHEQTVVMGYANRVISFFAKKILISWETSEKLFPRAKTVFTGIPLRESIFKAESKDFKVNKNLPTIYITGGKSGSHDINVAVSKILGALLQSCNVIHQCGDNTVYNDYEMLEEVHKGLLENNGEFFLRKYVLEDEIGEVYHKSDLVVSRAGAHTISELLALEKPAVLIPISWVSHNEQNENAKILKDFGLAEIIDETTMTPEILLSRIHHVLSNLENYKLINRDARKLIRKDSATLIANEILSLLKAPKASKTN